MSGPGTSDPALERFDSRALELALATPGERPALIRQLTGSAREHGVWPASIAPVYRRLAAADSRPVTVPGLNIRGLSYDLARAAWRAALRLEAGPIIFELAPSEARTGDQSFAEYAAMVMAAAAREGYRGPVFLQGDHFGIYTDSAEAIGEAQSLARRAIEAGLYQIDVDAAGLATHEGSLPDRLAPNIRATAQMISFVRALRADAAIGGEVGEIGGSNTTAEDMRAFLAGLGAALPSGVRGLDKISVQSGTRHGGVVDESGAVGRMPLDVPLLVELSRVAREEYGLPGVVQHGASTLTLEQLGQLPGAGVIEVHLATGIQNLVLDHPAMPPELVLAMKRALTAPASEGAEGGEYELSGTSPEQLYYHNRWQAWGRFKRELWSLTEESRSAIRESLEEWFTRLFGELRLPGRGDLLEGLEVS